jgi:spore coat protein CotF
MNSNCFNDQQMMGDVLSTQKFITNGYNNNAIEASGAEVKNVLLSILDEEQTLQHEIFTEMQGRGWYQTEAAQQAKIQETKSKFQENCHCCCQS